MSFAEDSYTVTEEDVDKNMQLILNLSESIEDTINVNYSIIDETATGGIDFIDIANGSVTILPNTTSIPINIQIKGDDLSEGDETFKVVVSTPPSNAYFFQGVSKLEAKVTIYDDEPILLSVSTSSFSVEENVVNGYFIIDLELSSAVSNTHSTTSAVSYTTEVNNLTARNGEDFRDPIQSPINVEMTATTSSILIPIIDDVEHEGPETFEVNITNVNGAILPESRSSITLEMTILDNEDPTLSFDTNSVDISEEDSDKDLELSLTLSQAIESPVEISYDVVEETATAGLDFTVISNGTISIPANQTSVPINIKIKGDDLDEGNETFKVRVAIPPTNAVFADGISVLEATVTIIDDESPTLSIDTTSLTISESAGTTQIELNLSGPTNEDIVVTYSTSITEVIMLNK